MPTKRADYIAIVDKAREFPWRAVVVTSNDSQLLNCDIAQRLAPECRIKDTSWIKPGKVAWDWWNNLNLTGVDFEAGINTNTYKYFIDFARKNNLEYIIIDEGWSSPEGPAGTHRIRQGTRHRHHTMVELEKYDRCM